MTDFSEYTLPQYWKHFKDEIAADRRWKLEDDDGYGIGTDDEEAYIEHEYTCKTRNSYDRHMYVLEHFLPQKAISKISGFEILQAIGKSRRFEGKTYADGTLHSRLSLCRRILQFAHDRGDACDDLRYMQEREQKAYIALDYTLPQKERERLAKPMLQESRRKQKSLNATQQKLLVKRIVENLECDGRYTAVAVLLYAGLRPSECRGLLWGDIVPFIDHPERHVLAVGRQRDQAGRLIDRLKRPASYRKTGIQIELERILQARISFMERMLPIETDFSTYPICCLGNDFKTPCKEHHLSKFATDLLKGLRIPDQVLTSCSLELYAYEPDLMKLEAEDINVSTYLLRHNFYTWIQAVTALTPEEKSYQMGHAIRISKMDLRPRFNNEEWLWDMLQKMDHDIKYLPLREDLLTITVGEENVSVKECGVQRLKIPKELLERGGKLSVILRGREIGDPIRIRPLSASKGLFVEESKLEMVGALMPCSERAEGRCPVCDFWEIMSYSEAPIPCNARVSRLIYPRKAGKTRRPDEFAPR